MPLFLRSHLCGQLQTSGSQAWLRVVITWGALHRTEACTPPSDPGVHPGSFECSPVILIHSRGLRTAVLAQCFLNVTMHQNHLEGC